MSSQSKCQTSSSLSGKNQLLDCVQPDCLCIVASINLISMYDLLTTEEDKAAAALGWTVQYVFDLERGRWTVQILPKDFAPPFDRTDLVTSMVVGMARQGDKLSIKALRLIAKPLTKKGKK